MSIDLSKISFGAIVGPGDGVTATKVSFGAIVGPPNEIVVTKISFGIIIDTLTPEVTARRRAAPVIS